MLERTHDGNGVEPYAKVPDWMRTLLQQVGKYVHAKTKPLELRIADLENRMAEFQYCGVWQNGVTYKRGNFVTFGGSIWFANVDTCEKPGPDPVAWTLACKRGRDGKDAR